MWIYRLVLFSYLELRSSTMYLNIIGQALRDKLREAAEKFMKRALSSLYRLPLPDFKIVCKVGLPYSFTYCHSVANWEISGTSLIQTTLNPSLLPNLHYWIARSRKSLRTVSKSPTNWSKLT